MYVSRADYLNSTSNSSTSLSRRVSIAKKVWIIKKASRLFYLRLLSLAGRLRRCVNTLLYLRPFLDLSKVIVCHSCTVA